MHKAVRHDKVWVLLAPACWVLVGGASFVAACGREDATAVETPRGSPSADAGQAMVTDTMRDAGTLRDADPAPAPVSTDAASGRDSGASTDSGQDASSAAVGVDTGVIRPPLPDYTLEVDAPKLGDTVRGSVVVRGRAPAFLNVEVWDAQHMKPPLGQTTPAADGSFELTVDVSSLSPGATSWTVFAWDSPAGQPFTRSDSVTLDLTIGAGPVVAACSGQSCSDHGTCSETSGQAVCSCESSYHAVGLTCVPDQTGSDGVPDPGMAYVPAGYQLAFSDEFTGSTLDTGKWNTLAPYGVQFYTDSHQKQAFIPEAVSLLDGILTFTAQRSNGSNTNGQPYSSGSVTTNRTFTHGYFEARAKVPAGKGLWPAYWLTSNTRWPPEWDIFEIIDGQIFGYTHPVSGGKCSFVEGAAGSDATYTLLNVYGVYHVYGFAWSETDLFWYVDGTLTEHYSVNAAAGANDTFWLNLSLQVGGDWPGDPDSSTKFPAQMQVDYVRVYEP